MDEEIKNTSRELLEELENCPVNFDPNFNHEFGTASPTKVAFVPRALFDELCAFLKML